ncbi:DUF4190 domain-containing protein [Nocardioides jensenii]|uniref:DUF4190 domain-containing protein n=1 Tax=Nocardioides jensenii TaxID=1843 RepID=UPI0012F73FA9|nr:DUF4190 domain-containing protein [Nocardioides jensenii]
MSTSDHQPTPPGQRPPVPPQGSGWGWPAMPIPPPQHPGAAGALTLGLVAVIGAVFCVVPILLSPVAWIRGRAVLKEIDANPQRWSGRDLANTGYILGIVGTALLALGVIGVGGVIALFLATE